MAPSTTCPLVIVNDEHDTNKFGSVGNFLLPIDFGPYGDFLPSVIRYFLVEGFEIKTIKRVANFFIMYATTHINPMTLSIYTNLDLLIYQPL